MHTSPNTTALPRADAVTDDVRDRINELERMYNPEAYNGNDHSDDDEADDSDDRVAREHAALTATETLRHWSTIPTGGQSRTLRALCRPRQHREDRAQAELIGSASHRDVVSNHNLS